MRFLAVVRWRDEAPPEAHEVAQLAHRGGRRPGLGHEVAAQEVGEDARVDLVGLHARRGDRLDVRGVRQLDLGGAAAERVVGVVPAAGRLEDDGAVVGHDRGDLLGGQVALGEDLAAGVHEAVLGAHLVHVEPQVVALA